MLHAEAAFADNLKPFAHGIVEVDVSHSDLFPKRREAVGINRKIVVLTRDFDRSRFKVLDRVIGSVVPKWELDRASTERHAE